MRCGATLLLWMRSNFPASTIYIDIDIDTDIDIDIDIDVYIPT